MHNVEKLKKNINRETTSGALWENVGAQKSASVNSKRSEGEEGEFV